MFTYVLVVTGLILEYLYLIGKDRKELKKLNDCRIKGLLEILKFKDSKIVIVKFRDSKEILEF